MAQGLAHRCDLTPLCYFCCGRGSKSWGRSDWWTISPQPSTTSRRCSGGQLRKRRSQWSELELDPEAWWIPGFHWTRAGEPLQLVTLLLSDSLNYFTYICIHTSDMSWCWWNCFVTVYREMEAMWVKSWLHLKSKFLQCVFQYFLYPPFGSLCILVSKSHSEAEYVPLLFCTLYC